MKNHSVLRIFPINGTSNALNFDQLKTILSEWNIWVAHGYTKIELEPIFDSENDVDIILRYEIRGYHAKQTVEFVNHELDILKTYIVDEINVVKNTIINHLEIMESKQVK